MLSSVDTLDLARIPVALYLHIVGMLFVNIASLAACVGGLCFFFFSSRRRHTILVSDWSSDVCSSDLDGKPSRNAYGGVKKRCRQCDMSNLPDEAECLARDQRAVRQRKLLSHLTRRAAF